MNTSALLATVATTIVIGMVATFATRLAIRLAIIAFVLGGGALTLKAAGDLARTQATKLVDTAKQQIADVPVIGAIADPSQADERAGEGDVVVRVIDGDTVELEHTGRARLIGIDTPETVKPNTPVQCYGPQASAATKRLLPKGTRVRVSFDREHHDHYGRSLVYLFAPSGRMVNATLVRQGYARTLRIEPNTRHAGRFAALQSEARAAHRGLWGAC